MIKMIKPIYALLVIVLIAGLAGASYIFYSNEGSNSDKYPNVSSFEECAALYPVMESYPERCATPDGKSFTKEYPTEPGNQSNTSNNNSSTPTPAPTPVPTNPGSGIPDGVVCTMDAMQCPDGSWVGRSGPNCEFVCPAN